MMERMLTDYDPRIRPDYSGTMYLLMIFNANRGVGGGDINLHTTTQMKLTLTYRNG